MKSLIKKIKQTTGGDFFKNVLVSLTGSGLAQLITLLALPILTRIFTPAEFGLFAIYLSIANIVGNVAGGRMDSAIMIPKEDKEAFNILALAIVLISITSLAAFLLVVILKSKITSLLSFSPHEWTFYFLPVSIFLISVNRTLTVWVNRFKSFKISSTGRVLQTGSTSGANITLGSFTQLGMPGLFTGHLTGLSISSLFLLNKSKKLWHQHPLPLKSDLKRTLLSNKNFIIFAVPFGLLSIFSAEFLIYYLSIFFSASLVGLYSNGNRIINYPLSLITVAFSSVFYQRISAGNNALKVFRLSWLLNFLLAFFMLIPVVLWGEAIFAFVLGDEWRMSGKFASILVPLAVSSFAARSVASVFSLLRKNEILLTWQIIYMMVILGVIYFFKDTDIQAILLYYSLAGAFLYLCQSFWAYQLMKRNKPNDRNRIKKNIVIRKE